MLQIKAFQEVHAVTCFFPQRAFSWVNGFLNAALTECSRRYFMTNDSINVVSLKKIPKHNLVFGHFPFRHACKTSHLHACKYTSNIKVLQEQESDKQNFI